MNVRKWLPGVLGTIALCVLLPLAPSESQAATITEVETPQAGDTQVWVQYVGARATDQFEVRVNGTVVNHGTLGNDLIGAQRIYFVLDKENPVKAGDQIVVSMTDAEGDMTSAPAVTVAGEQTPNAPTSMRLESDTVAEGDPAFATLIFDEDYVPQEDDRILVQRYDADDNELGEGYLVDLPDVYSGPVKIQLKDSAETDHYTLAFIPGSGSTTLQPVRIDVTEGGDNPGGGDEPSDGDEELIANSVAMNFTYPDVYVSLGESVTPTIQLIDAEGNATTYTGPAIFSYSGEAIVDGSFDANGRFTVGSEQELIGTKIQVTAMVGGKFSKTVELTVQAGDKSLILSPESGSMGSARAVTFQLADGSGNHLRLVWEPTVAEVIIRPTDPESDAKMAGSVTNLSSLTTNGSGTMLLSSDMAAEAQVYIIFRDNSGRFYQTAVSDFTFTEATADDPLSVTLTIGSKNYEINGIAHQADTAAIVQNGRTFIPFRLLVEALGGSVVFDDTTQTITAVYGGTTVQMSVGSSTYTVNGNQQQMDVAPFINSDNRTLVPLRFMADAFGCTTTPHYTNGLTTSVTVER